jgi:hypothetical protein
VWLILVFLRASGVLLGYLFMFSDFFFSVQTLWL